MKIYEHYSKYPMSKWRWPDFLPVEMACRGDDNLVINIPAMNKLQALREELGIPLIVNSAYRSPTYNARIGGATKSKHLLAQAFDISMTNHKPAVFEAAARKVGFTGFGFYRKSNFIHIDIGPTREWGGRWFGKSGDHLPLEVSTRRAVNTSNKPLVKSRTMRGAGTAGVVGVGSFVKEAVDLVESQQSQLSSGDFIPVAVAALIVAGALYAAYARWQDSRSKKHV